MTENSFKDLRAKLDEFYRWPCYYTFKFIVPKAKLANLLPIFYKGAISKRDSKHGKYIAVTVEAEMNSSGEVLSIYQQAMKIEGIVSL